MSAQEAAGVKARTRSPRFGTKGPGPVICPSGTYLSRKTPTTARSSPPATIRNPA